MIIVIVVSFFVSVVADAGRHMEHSIVAACVSLLLGCAVQDSRHYMQHLVKCLPTRSLEPLSDVLKKLHEFARLAVSHTISLLVRMLHFLTRS